MKIFTAKVRMLKLPDLGCRKVTLGSIFDPMINNESGNNIEFLVGLKD